MCFLFSIRSLKFFIYGKIHKTVQNSRVIRVFYILYGILMHSYIQQETKQKKRVVHHFLYISTISNHFVWRHKIWKSFVLISLKWKTEYYTYVWVELECMCVLFISSAPKFEFRIFAYNINKCHVRRMEKYFLGSMKHNICLYSDLYYCTYTFTFVRSFQRTHST